MDLTPDCKIRTEQVAAIAAIEDDSYRNRWIVYAYHDISERLQPFLGYENASFATFATWSSRIIGEQIRTDARNSKTVQIFDAPHNPFWWVGPPFIALQRGIRERADSSISQVMGLGNRLIFHEIAGELCRFVERCEGGGDGRPEWDEYVKGIEELPASELFPAADFDRFRDGMRAYHLAHEQGLVANDPDTGVEERETALQLQAELVLRGTLLISSYEQRRVDVVLKAALSLFPRRLLLVRPRQALSVHTNRAAGNIELRRHELPWRLRHRSPWRRVLARIYARFLTRRMMTLEIPKILELDETPSPLHSDLSARARRQELLADREKQFETLQLGRALNQLGDSLYMGRLADITKFRDQATRAVFEGFDRSRGTAQSCRSRDWGDYDDRMSYIANYFRARQCYDKMFARLPFEYRIVSELDLSNANLKVLRGLGDKAADDLATEVAIKTKRNGRDLLPELVRVGLGPEELGNADVAGATADALAGLASQWYPEAKQEEERTEQPSLEPKLLPDWLDQAMLRRGQKFFQQFKVEIASALFNAGLPFTYTAAHGARVLTETADRLASSEHLDDDVVDLVRHVERRIAETGQMLLDIMGAEDGGAPPFAPTTAAFRAARGVRLFHASVRHQLREVWDVDRLGAPVNQEDLLGTLAVFTVVVIDALRAMGARVSPSESAAYVHTWLVVGHLMGIQYELLYPHGRKSADLIAPLGYEELQAYLQRYSELHCQFNVDGCRLAKGLLRAQESRFRGPFTSLPAASIRFFIGDERADQLGLPPMSRLRHLFKPMKFFTEVRTALYHVHWIGRKERRRTYGLFRKYINETTRGQRPGWRIAPLAKRRAASSASDRERAA